jgi:methionyl aminopeptidase
MIFYKTDEEIAKIREACHLVCKTLALVGSHIKPGVSGKFLDQLAEEFILDHGARPAFKGYRSFPSTLCFSPNEVVVHGIPTDAEIKPADIISVDCGVELDGYFGDAAYTFALTGVNEPALKLCSVTRQSLYQAIDQAVHGKRIGDISFAVQNLCERQHKYGVVRELTGHGLGKSLHEEPDVPNYGRRGEGTKLLDGLVIAIEPMITQGRQDIAILDDDWTIITKDRKVAAHYEHTIVVRKQKADILSDHSYIEAAIKNNAELVEIP